MYNFFKLGLFKVSDAQFSANFERRILTFLISRNRIAITNFKNLSILGKSHCKYREKVKVLKNDLE